MKVTRVLIKCGHEQVQFLNPYIGGQNVQETPLRRTKAASSLSGYRHHCRKLLLGRCQKQQTVTRYICFCLYVLRLYTCTVKQPKQQNTSLMKLQKSIVLSDICIYQLCIRYQNTTRPGWFSRIGGFQFDDLHTLINVILCHTNMIGHNTVHCLPGPNQAQVIFNFLYSIVCRLLCEVMKICIAVVEYYINRCPINRSGSTSRSQRQYRQLMSN